ncbi:B1 protein [Bacillus rossius redtenbacheri]|uniref:B1 protein n=1 Tax=Bacillus rossius redtenbacheri TaxID=93214 RepID=UPI002FDD8A8B
MLKQILVALLAAFALASTVQADELEDMKKMLHETCQKEIKADEGLIGRAQKGDFVEDPKLKDYMKCVFTQLAVMNEAGEMDYDMMMSMMPDEIKVQGQKVVADCRGTTGETPGDVAMNFNKCFFKSQPSIYFLI